MAPPTGCAWWWGSRRRTRRRQPSGGRRRGRKVLHKRSDPIMGDGSRSLVRAAARARGGRRGSCERDLSRGLHGEAGQRGLRAPRLPEESHARDRDAEARTRSDQSAPAMGPAPRARRGGGGMKIIKSSGNVFADLGLPGAEERLLKARLAAEIARTIARRKLT